MLKAVRCCACGGNEENGKFFDVMMEVRMRASNVEVVAL